MRYTAYNNPQIQEKIERDITLITENIIKNKTKWGIISFILYGGFARGEGSVEVHGDNARPLNDYDFIAVTEYPVPAYLSFKKFTQELNSHGRDYNVDMVIRPLWFMKRVRPTIFYYELKKGGRVLWGEDVLSLMPEIDPCAIPLRDGISTFFNRLMSLLEAYAIEDRKIIIYQCNKAILTWVEMLLLLSSNYHWSYKERLSIFKSIFEKAFPRLAVDCPELLPLAERATRFKLLPDYNLYPEEDIWDKVAPLYFKILNFYLAEFVRRQGDSDDKRWIDFMRTSPFKTIPSWVIFKIREMTERDFSRRLSLGFQPYLWAYLAGYEWLKAWVLKDNYSQIRKYLNYLGRVDNTDDLLILKDKIILSWKKSSFVL